ncbi:MAG: hypothetical protein EA402_04310 [Planctomycetota bacterium]|nr:MAG: hypothetical protein EA402_04310 [Planctomycetota bacterium]
MTNRYAPPAIDPHPSLQRACRAGHGNLPHIFASPLSGLATLFHPCRRRPLPGQLPGPRRLVDHAPRSRHKLLYLAIALLLLAAGYLWLRGGIEGRAQALLSDLAEGVERGYPRLLVGLVDADYPLLEHWPELEALRQADDADGHQALQRALAAYFFQQRGSQRQLSWQLHHLERLPSNQGHRDYAAVITLGLNLEHQPRGTPQSVAEHRFILRQRGWFLPSFTIRDHDPLPRR